MFEKLSDLKAKADESQARLEGITITEESGGGLVRVSMNGNRVLKAIEINVDLASIDKDELEDLLIVAFEKAMNKVNNLNEQEVMSSANSLFPGL